MAPDSAKYLWDVQQAAARALRFVQGKRFEDERVDELLRSAVERQLEVVGEALNLAPLLAGVTQLLPGGEGGD